MFVAALGLGVASLGFLIAAIVGSSQIWQWPAIGCALIGLVLLVIDHIRHRGDDADDATAAEHQDPPHHHHSHRRQDSK